MNNNNNNHTNDKKLEIIKIKVELKTYVNKTIAFCFLEHKKLKQNRKLLLK